MLKMIEEYAKNHIHTENHAYIQNHPHAKNYAHAEQLLEEIPRFTSKNPFDATKAFYDFVQSEACEEKLGAIIHVAGTNGKGSVCAFLHQIFVESGYHAAMFTSPHLITTRERFVIDGEMVSEEEFVCAFNWLADKLNEYRSVNAGYMPTYFERLFFMGMYIFTKAGVQITVLETGLGGRLDTTNVIKNPALCVITKIAMDHMAYLGDTIEEIAYEKAGIIKHGAPVVFEEQKSEVCDVFYKKASESGAKCYVLSKNKYKINEIKKKYIDFSINNRYYKKQKAASYNQMHGAKDAPFIGNEGRVSDNRYDDYDRFICKTRALYQAQNAAVALKACETLERECGFGRLNVKQGIENMKWAGRMEEVHPGFYIDGAHNEDGIEAFAHSIENAADLDRCMLIFSAAADKRYDKMIEKLCSLDKAAEFAITRIAGGRGADIYKLAGIFKEHTDKEVHTFEKIEDAISYCLDKRKGTGCDIFAVGSLYLAGAVRRFMEVRDDRF